MEDKPRISINTVVVLTVFALVIDLGQILLDAIVIGVVVNRIIDVFVTFGFWIVFRFMGVNFSKTRAFVFFGLALLEMFPGLDAFPLWTADVLAVCFMTMAEDKIEALGGKKDESGKKKGGLRKDFDTMGAKGIAKNDRRTGDLKNASSGIINVLQRTKNVPRPTMSRTASRARQNYDAQLSKRDAQIAAQRERKQNANENEQKKES